MDPPTKGHVIQRMRDPKIAMVRYVQPQGCLMTAIISETTTLIIKKFQDNIWTTKMCPEMQYYDVITNLKMADGRHYEDH